MSASMPVNTNNFKGSMDKSEGDFKENAIVVLNGISKLVQDIEKKMSLDKVKAKECEELKLLKEKCCDNKLNVSSIAFHGISTLVKRKTLNGSQTISILISLMPNITHYSGLVSTIGDILLLDLQEQLSQKNTYQCIYGTGNFKHPLIVVLKHNREKSWFPIYLFILKLLQDDMNISPEHKIKLLRPIFHLMFWSSFWQGSQFQLKLFNALIMHLNQKEILNFTLEVLMWQDMDIYYCLFLQDLLINLLKLKNDENNLIISALTPTLALVIKWLIVNGHDPVVWIRILASCIEIDNAGCSAVLYILSDVILDTPLNYINLLVDVCKSIIFNSSCNKYVAHKFVAVVLNWMVNPTPLANPLYKTLEEIIKFSNERLKWNDMTQKLIENEYYKVFGSTNKDVKFAVDLIVLSNYWCVEKKSVLCWLRNLNDSNQLEIQLKLHLFINGIVLCESDSVCINLCLCILLGLIKQYKDISFSHLCLIFYKLGHEMDPSMQKTYLFTLPQLAVKKENIPLIVGIIESLKKGLPKIMTPLVIQLYLLLWKYDNRTYFYLHKMLHDTSSENFSWELNISKAMALREICQLAPHLHAKDLVVVLSKILNECAGHPSGLPSAISIEAVTELCKSYVIDVAGTWSAIQPKLCVDKRPQVIISLCKFFGQIPDISLSGQNNRLTYDVIPMLWNYTFINNPEVVKHSYRALSKFNIENLPLKLFPEVYRVDIRIPKDYERSFKSPEDILTLPYVPAECWVQFIEKINEDVLEEGGELLIVIIERELNSLPRGVFYLPPEKSEPSSYSYIPQKSIFRALVERLQRHSKITNETLPHYVKEIIRVISHEYTKLLPPLNWSFMEKFLNLDSKSSHATLALLAKQGSTFKSAKTVLENYLKTVEWTVEKSEDILFLYEILPLLCKGVSYNIFQNFVEVTVPLFLEGALAKNNNNFEKILESLTKTLKNQTIQPGHKTLIARQLENVFAKIPPEMLERYALFAVELPVQSTEYMTSTKASSKIEEDWLRRAIFIKQTVAVQSDKKNALIWLEELTEKGAICLKEQNFFLDTIYTVIRHTRTCDHTTWLLELTWRIHEFIIAPTRESNEETLFLINVFISATIVFSGYDCFFMDVAEFTTNMSKKLEVFPQALSVLLHFSNWQNLQPKIALWLQILSKWKNLPNEYVTTIARSLLTLKETKCYADDNITAHLNMYLIPSV